MITRKQSIEQFRVRMDELIESNYILADKKITAVLKTVTASKLFYELISFCAENFDYAKERDEIFCENGFRFPKTDKCLIAFVFCLFCEFDAGGEDLLKILDRYFSADNYDKSYKAFCSELLKPFEDCVLRVVDVLAGICADADGKMSPEQFSALRALDTTKGEPAAQNGEFLPSEEEKVFEVNDNFAPASESGRKNYYTCFADIQKILLNEKTKIMHCKIKDDKKNDLLLLLSAFKDCLFLGNKDQIKVAFVSYKYGVMNFKRLDSEVEDIERILKFCKIL